MNARGKEMFAVSVEGLRRLARRRGFVQENQSRLDENGGCMKLAALIRKDRVAAFATATHATIATYAQFKPPTVAHVAAVAVANFPKSLDHDGVDERAGMIEMKGIYHDEI